MSTQNIPTRNGQRVRINRANPRPEVFPGVVHGSCEQVAPNGLTFDGDTAMKNAMDASGIGAVPTGMPVGPTPWSGNRSGE